MKYSIGEQFVSKILKEYDIDFTFDTTIEDLKGVRNGTLRFDFVIEKNRNRVIIEYNGIFHYHVIHGKTSMYTLSKQQMNDIIKHDFCLKQKIPILWIPYWLNSQQIRTSIEFFLLKHKFI